MQTILAHFDGKSIIPDQPLALPVGQALRVGIERLPTPLPPLPAELETAEFGGVRVRGTRVSLFLQLDALDAGETWEQLLERYPTVPQSAVAGLQQFIEHHSAELKTYLASERDFIKSMSVPTNPRLTLDAMRKKA